MIIKKVPIIMFERICENVHAQVHEPRATSEDMSNKIERDKSPYTS